VELGRTVEKYSNMESQRAAHPFIGGVGRTVEKYFNTWNHKEQHITQSLLYRWELGRTVEKYSNM
jgi:hypothetical protein